MNSTVNSPTSRVRTAVFTTSAVALVAATIAVSTFALASAGQIDRTEYFRADLVGSPTTEVVVARLELAPGAVVPPHSHNGEEHLVVLQGGPMTMASGETMELQAGMTLDFERDQVHGGLTSAGDSPLVFLTIHFVDKDAPLNVAAQ